MLPKVNGLSGTKKTLFPEMSVKLSFFQIEENMGEVSLIPPQWKYAMETAKHLVLNTA